MTPQDKTRAILDSSREDMNRAEIKRINDDFDDMEQRVGGGGAGVLTYVILILAALALSCAGSIVLWAK